MDGMESDIVQLFTPQPIMGVTINTAFLHPAVRSFMLVLIVLALIIGTIVFLIRNDRIAVALKRASIIAFIISGLIYALHADIGWATWLTTDFKLYAGLGTDEKLLRMEGGLYEFVRRSRDMLPDTYQMYSTDTALAWRMEYFLLPKRKRANAQFIIVLADKPSRYDVVKHQFIRDDVTIDDVDMALPFAINAYMLRRRQ